jgi:hypothetical protein
LPFFSRKYLFIALLSLLTFVQVKAQGEWNQFYDYSRKYHFGFMIGTNFANFKYRYSPEWYQQDTIKVMEVKRLPGITIAGVADVHLGEHFNLRFVPSLVLSQRNVLFSNDTNKAITVKEVESAYFEFPVLLKFKSERHRNMRYYVIGGFKYGHDFSSEEGSKRNPADPKIFIKKSNFSYEYGTGLDMYFKYFKFSPEIKLSRGLNNVLIPDNSIYSRMFENFRSTPHSPRRRRLYNSYRKGQKRATFKKILPDK